jgi:rhodanese-related sulfurtransferase
LWKRIGRATIKVMGTRAAKDALYDAFAEVSRAMASGRRAELIDVLAQGERSVDGLAAEIDQSTANTSHHLQTLARAGLVASRRAGTRIYYRLASPEIEHLWSALRKVAAKHVAGIDDLARAYLGDRSQLEAITRDELATRLQRGDILVLDIRPDAEFRAGHIPGARSIPPRELKRALDELPAGVDIVAYCRGPYCVYADDAVRELHRRGREARRLEDGYPEWRRDGRPIELRE